MSGRTKSATVAWPLSVALESVVADAGRSGEVALRPTVRGDEAQAVLAQGELADLVGVGHAARLEHADAAVAVRS